MATIIAPSYTAAAAYANSLLRTATTLGIERQSLLDKFNISEDLLASPANRVPLQLFLDLANHIALKCDRDDIGLLMAEQARPGTYSALGYAAMSCATLLEAALLIPRYEDVVINAGNTKLSHQGDIATISWVSKLNDNSHYILNDVIVAGWFCFAKWATNVNDQYPLTVRFSHSKPKDIAHYESLFQCPIEFSSPSNEIEFETKLLSTSIAQVDREFNQLMQAKADQLMNQLVSAGTAREKVVAIIRDILPKHEATITTVAKAMGISERTLRRRLAEEDCSFQQLLTEIRVRLANVYLDNPELSILDIALLLGYSDQSAFSSAFKNWHGITPSAWQKERGLE